eukprot:2144961-Rhodomonas_salina.2
MPGTYLCPAYFPILTFCTERFPAYAMPSTDRRLACAMSTDLYAPPTPCPVLSYVPSVPCPILSYCVPCLHLVLY